MAESNGGFEPESASYMNGASALTLPPGPFAPAPPPLQDPIPNDPSSIKNGGTEKSPDPIGPRVEVEGPKKNSIINYVSVAILFVVNLLNYMDRFTVAALLTQIKPYYGINDSLAGLLQTVFICAYLIFAPICGYLGDRFNRKLIIAAGVFVWSAAVLASSFVPQNHFWAFFALRGVVGIGEASYSNIAPTILADMFTKDALSKCLMLFYFAIPVGSGLGYVVGSQVAKALNDWRWGIRVTPIAGAVLLILFIFIVREPKRGEAEGAQKSLKANSWISDIKYLTKNKTYLIVVAGSTCLAFVTGSFAWWIPTMSVYSVLSTGQYTEGSLNSLLFGAVSALGGLIGVVAGSMIAQRWRRTQPKADALVCGIGLIASVPPGYVAFCIMRINVYVVWPLLFVSMVALSLNWAVLNDIIMYIVVPTRRATAISFQTMTLHLLGDAASPYIIGVMSVALQGNDHSDFNHYRSLQYAMFLQFFVMVLGGALFLVAAWYVEHDKNEAKAEALRLVEEEGLIRTVEKIPYSELQSASQSTQL